MDLRFSPSRKLIVRIIDHSLAAESDERQTQVERRSPQ